VSKLSATVVPVATLHVTIYAPLNSHLNEDGASTMGSLVVPQNSELGKYTSRHGLISTGPLFQDNSYATLGIDLDDTGVPAMRRGEGMNGKPRVWPSATTDKSSLNRGQRGGGANQIPKSERKQALNKFTTLIVQLAIFRKSSSEIRRVHRALPLRRALEQ
jgi:hypothetical protein